MGAHFELGVEEGTLWFGEAERARKLQALKRAIFVTLAGTAGMLAFLIPDFFGTYRHTDPTGGWIFLASIFGIGLLIGVALGISRWVRKERWVLDATHKTLAFERRLLGRAPMVESVGFSEIEKLVWKESELVMRLTGGEAVPLLKGGTREEQEQVVARIEAYVQRRRAALKIERA